MLIVRNAGTKYKPSRKQQYTGLAVKDIQALATQPDTTDATPAEVCPAPVTVEA